MFTKMSELSEATTKIGLFYRSYDLSEENNLQVFAFCLSNYLCLSWQKKVSLH